MDYDHYFNTSQEAPAIEVRKPNEGCTRKRTVFSFIIFIYGFTSIGNMGFYSLLKDKMHLDPSELNAYFTFINLLFLLKPLYGLLTDTLYIFGRRRQPYVIICSFIASVLWILMAFCANTALTATLLLFFINGMFSLITTVAQALLVEDSQEKSYTQDALLGSSRKKERGFSYNEEKAVQNISLFFLLDSAGLLLSSYLSGYLVDTLPLPGVFLVSSAIPILMFCVGVFINEKRANPHKDEEKKPQDIEIASNSEMKEKGKMKSKEESKEKASEDEPNSSHHDKRKKKVPWKTQIKRVCAFLKIKMIYLPIIFIFLFTITPSTYDAMMYFYLNELHFDYEMIGRINFISSAAMMMGITLYSKWLYKYSFKHLVAISTALGGLFNFSQLILIFRWNTYIGLPDSYLALSLDLVTNTFAQLQVMPVLVLTCKLCPKHLEAVIYETIIGIRSVAYFISYRSGGVLTSWLGITAHNFSNLWILMLISTAFPLAMLVLLLCIPIKSNYNEEFELLEQKIKLEAENIPIMRAS